MRCCMLWVGWVVEKEGSWNELLDLLWVGWVGGWVGELTRETAEVHAVDVGREDNHISSFSSSAFEGSGGWVGGGRGVP